MRHMLALTAVLTLVVSCSPSEEAISEPTSSTTTTSAATTTTSAPTTTTTELPTLAMTSPAFTQGGVIPVEYTCDGADVSPELNIVGLPAPTRALAIIVEDPDAPLGTWYHWVEFDIPADTGSFDIQRATAEIGVRGVNSWNLEGYMGPCPPEGEEHDYIFRIYALSSDLGLPPGVDADEIIGAIDDHVIDTVELTGVYGR